MLLELHITTLLLFYIVLLKKIKKHIQSDLVDLWKLYSIHSICYILHSLLPINIIPSLFIQAAYFVKVREQDSLS